MNQKRGSKIILKQWVQVFLLIVILIIMAGSIWAIAKSISGGKEKKEELYTYSYNSNLSYRVFLKNNSFFTTKTLGMNKQYIASLIDHIEVNAKYNFQSSKDLEYTYSYDMVATAKGSYSESDAKAVEVWSKSYSILPSETKSGTGKTIAIDKTANVDYNLYNQVMVDFRNQFGLSVDASVDVALRINITGGLKGEEKTLQETSTMTLLIPLVKPTIEIKPDYVNNGGKTVYKELGAEDVHINIPLLVLGIALLLFMVYMLKKMGSQLITTTKKSEYVMTLNKILKEYSDIIAKAENIPNLTQYDVIHIKDFADLVDIEEELHSPIIYNEIREDLECWFMIFNDKTAYKFILRYEDFARLRR